MIPERNTDRMKLPERFLDNMKPILGTEYEAWLACYEEPSFQGLRINRRKLTTDQWGKISPYGTEAVPWTENGYYVAEELRPSKDAYYYAGLYYIQEPSAMAPAALLPVKPGARLLDLCAAPGGKSTELGARLQGRGILISNDISNSRARALLKNLELFGIPNICVTSEEPEKLADTFGAFFDGILVDAPCSGEGMFRKDPDLIKSWMERGPEYYAPIQKEILKQAVRMLRPGGHLLYSTCTFAREEDEAVIEQLLQESPEMELVPIPLWDGAKPGLEGQPVVRLFPHKIRGEGHFAAFLRKRETAEPGLQGSGNAKQSVSASAHGTCSADIRRLEQETDFLEWEGGFSEPFDRSRMMIKDNLVYLLPEEFDRGWRLRYLRTGLLLGEMKKKRFEPSQAAAMVLDSRDYSLVCSFDRGDDRAIRYLKGETIALEPEEQRKKGWALVCVDGFPLGWARYAGASLKNKYYPGWRWQ